MPKPPEQRPKEAKDCQKSPVARSHWHCKASEDGFFLSLGTSSKKGPASFEQPVSEQASEASSAAVEGGCLAWLSAWEVRQERLLRRHEEAMLKQLEALRREVLQKERRKPGVSRCSSASSMAQQGMAAQQASPVELARRWQSDGTVRSLGVEDLEGGESGRSLASPARRKAERPDGRLRSAAFDIVHCRAFVAVTSAMVILYTLAVGAMAEAEMRTALAGAEEPLWLLYVDAGFTASFLLEVMLRIVSDGRSYFVGAERKWNIFDSCVAAVGVADVGLGMHMNLGFFRILRACRVVRVLKVLRTFSALRDLRLMVESLCACVPCLGWGLVLLGSLQYIFAVVMLRGTQQLVRDGSLSATAEQIVRESFCGIPCAMRSLMQAISGGRSWGEFTQPFEEVSPAFGLLFPAFMLFVIFGALNILTGIFVESTSSIARQNKELAVEEELARAQGAEGQIREFFEELDTDQSGTLSMEELTTGLQDPRVKAYFKVLQINAEDSRILFTLLDDDHSGEVSIEEFTEKCQSLRGGARAMDLAAVLKDNGKMQKQFKYLMRNVQEVSQKMRRDSKMQPPPEF